MALTKGRQIQERDGRQFAYPPAAAATIHVGALVMLASGELKPAAPGADATAAALLIVVGVAEQPASPTAPTPSGKVQIRTGCFLFDNSAGGDAITLADVGDDCFAVDDQRVAKTSATNVRPRAGTIVDVESAGVWVRVGVAA